MGRELAGGRRLSLSGPLMSIRLLVALLVRVREIRTPAKLGVPNIFERPTPRPIDKSVDNHGLVGPKTNIQNTGRGGATLRVADENQKIGFVGD